MTTIVTKYPFIGSVDTKQGGRNENQDNAGFVDTPLGLLLVVCDGMGGGPGGRTASLMAVDTILSVLSDVSEHTPREDALRFAIEKANDVIYAKAKEKPELRGMGTTVAAVLFNENSAVIAHAGDTRIYQLRKGAIMFRSSDHSVVANLVRQKQITEEEARNHPQANIVTRALGIRPSMEIEFDEVTFLRGDRFVICTDGIWGMMPQRDLVRSLSQVMGIEELTSTLTEGIDKIGHANGGGHDNLTLAIVDTSFDSLLNKIKKKSHAEMIDVDSNDATAVSSIKKKASMLVIVSIVIFPIIVVTINSFFSRSESERTQEMREMRGITTTTVGHEVISVKDSDSVNMDSCYVDELVVTPNQSVVGNPFLDSTIRNEQTLEVSRQINCVVKNLDNLKKINEGNKGRSEEKKRKYIKEVIKPAVNSLGNKVAVEKKDEIREILRLLNDKKIVSCDKFGHTTNSSRRHIEEIKVKVRGLQN